MLGDISIAEENYITAPPSLELTIYVLGLAMVSLHFF